MKPSDEQRKMLSEFIGECYHETRLTLTPFGNRRICDKCDSHFDTYLTNRTFTTWADIEPVKKALEEKGMMEEFESWLFERRQSDQMGKWLFGKDDEGYRFCGLVAEFMEGKG
jgi:hypothetical protein